MLNYFLVISKKVKHTISNIKKSKFLVENIKSDSLLLILSFFIFSSFVLFTNQSILYGDNVTDLQKILNFYAFIVVLRFLAYGHLFKKISISKNQFRDQFFIPSFILPAELVFVYLTYKKDKIFSFDILSLTTFLNKIIENGIFVTIIFFFLLVYILTQKDKFSILKTPLFYLITLIEMSLISILYLPLAVLNSKLVFIIKEIILYGFFVFYFTKFINKTQDEILSTRNTRQNPGKLIRISGKIVEELSKRKKYEFFFKFEKTQLFYKIKSKRKAYFLEKPQFKNLNFDFLTKKITLGDEIFLVGLSYNETFEDGQLNYIFPLYLQIKRKSVVRNFF